MPITVQFATNRRLTGSPNDLSSYGNDMVPPSDPTQVIYGTAFVNEVDLTADTVGAITAIQNVRQGGFSQQAAGDLGNAGRNLLVFIHGFDNSFENALTRAAFNREWLAQAGIPAADTSVVAFSWPSEGRLIGFPLPWEPYKSDQVMAGSSGLHLMRFFANLAPILRTARAHGRRTILLAHSMGHFALQSAVQNWFSHGNADGPLFDEAILAAADEEFDTFAMPKLGRLSGLERLVRHTSILFSRADQVLDLSHEVNGIQRLGQAGPSDRSEPGHFPADRYTMLDCSGCRDFEDGFANSHQYYRRSPSVRSFMARLIAGWRPPG